MGFFMINRLLILIIFTTAIIVAREKASIESYKKAKSFLWENRRSKTHNVYTTTHWLPDNSGVWYIHTAPESKQYRKIHFSTLKVENLFDHQKFAEIITDSLSTATENDLPISKLEYRSSDSLIITINQKLYHYNEIESTLNEYTPELKNENDWSISPDGKWKGFQKGFNLYLKDQNSGDKQQLSFDGNNHYRYGSWLGWSDIMEGECDSLPDNFWIDWSENSKWLAVNISDTRSAKKMYMLDHSIDSLYRPKLLSYYRGSPGDTSIAYSIPKIYSSDGRLLKLDLPRATHINSHHLDWLENDKLLIKSTSRGFKVVSFHIFDLNSETLREIYREKSDTNIDNFEYEIVGNDILFLSEKSGWRQLYKLNLADGNVKSLTNGKFYINSLVKIDSENDIIYFMGSGKIEGKNPYYEDLYSISLNGVNLTQLTDENCNHNIKISPDGKFFIDNYSTVNTPNKAVLRDLTTGKILVTLSETYIDGFDQWSPPEIYSTIGKDGKSTIYGAIWKPTNFDPDSLYPIIDNSYSGPHTQMLPKNYWGSFINQSLAELGFIVVTIDGLGSSGRSKAFHDHSYKNLGDNLRDHTIFIRDLTKNHSYIDTYRVGIFGHSAGGYDAAHALLAYPDFYKVGVASSGDHDHRMEKAWWPEMYMGWPVDSTYHQQSNVTMAANLKGKLLLVHGGIDENVNPSATFKLSEALIKADKPFDLLIIPSQRHGYNGLYNNYFRKRMWNYFIEHLQGKEPLWEY